MEALWEVSVGWLLLVMGCVSDSDGDGLDRAEERELGTDPKSADTDGDGLSDSEEVELGTDALSDDSDSDSLADAEEEDLGTDPTSADSDGDAIDDGVEVEADPALALNPYRWPDGLWPDFRSNAEDLSGTGWALGDVAPSFGMRDQFGNDVELYQFYGMVTLVDFSTGWCGPCRSLAALAEEEYQGRADQGFVTIHVIFQDNMGRPPDETFLEGWATLYGITFPVTYELEDFALDGLDSAGTYPGTIPFQVLLDRDLRIDMAFSGSPNDPILTRVDELLAE